MADVRSPEGPAPSEAADLEEAATVIICTAAGATDLKRKAELSSLAMRLRGRAAVGEPAPPIYKSAEEMQAAIYESTNITERDLSLRVLGERPAEDAPPCESCGGTGRKVVEAALSEMVVPCHCPAGDPRPAEGSERP